MLLLYHWTLHLSNKCSSFVWVGSYFHVLAIKISNIFNYSWTGQVTRKASISALSLSLDFLFQNICRPLRLELSPEEEVVASMHMDTIRCRAWTYSHFLCWLTSFLFWCCFFFLFIIFFSSWIWRLSFLFLLG